MFFSKKSSSFIKLILIDTGFFSIQVLQRALKICDLELVPFASQESVAQQARNHPESVQAYICNLGLHWFTMRRFGKQYFDLNSFYYAPKFLINQSLQAFLNLIQKNGYSVFIVDGELPKCLADQQLTANPISRAEYEVLIKDLPRFVADDKIIGNLDDLPKSKQGNLLVKVPRDVFAQLEKNPDDPYLRQMIYAQLPKEFFDEGIPDHAGCSNPDHHHHPRRPRRQLLIAPMSENDTDEDLMGVCDCPRHRQHSKVSPQQFKEQVIDDSNTDNSNRSHPQSTMITQETTQYIVITQDRNNPDAPLQQQIITTTRLIAENRSAYRNDTLTDNRDIQRRTKPNLAVQNGDDLLLQHALTRSLLDGSEMDVDTDIQLLEDQTEQIYQRLIDIAIADSLQSNNLAIEQSGNTPELIPMTTMNSEPITMKIPPPLTNTHSSPPTNTYFLPPINTSSSSPSTNTFSTHPINTTSPTPTTPNLLPPTTASLPPPPTPNLPVTMSSPSSSTSNLPATTSSSPTLNLLATTSSPTTPNLPVTTSSPPTWTPSSPAATSSASPPTPNLVATTASPPSTTPNSPSPTITNSNFPESPSIEGKLFKAILR